MARNTPAEITRLIEAAITIAGSEDKLGKAAGYSQNAIWHAKRKGRISAEMATAIDRATDGAVGRHRLRPDLFGAPTAPASEAQAGA